MSKPREDYEKTWWRRLERFVNGERIEVHEYHDIFEQNPSFLKEDILNVRLLLLLIILI